MFQSSVNGDKVKVFVLPNGEKILSDSELIQLPNPKTGKPVLFMLTKENEEKSRLFEVNQYQDEFSSWFIGNELVKSDSKLHIVTPYDPLYLLLPFLKNCSGNVYCILDQLVDCENGDAIISSIRDDKQIEKISDLSASGDVKAYKYNEEKTLCWLKAKVELLSKSLNSNLLYIPKEDNDSVDAEKESKVRCAWGMISEYLSEDLKEKLRTTLGISLKRKKAIGEDGNASKKAKIVEANEDYSKDTFKVPKQSTKAMSRTEKALQKIDKKGMKSISSFFKPKAAKS